ncbi:MAG: SDR family NAD(P)-dependent oxidoreductase [Gammaproteobacteria bacterium]
MQRLSKRVAVVTGAGDGIGRAIARRLAAEGAAVVVAEFDRGSGEQAATEIMAAGGRALFHETDVGDKASLLAMLSAGEARFGGIDILVNNAYRGSGTARVERKTDAEFATALAMGLWACQWTMQAVLPHMRAQGWGRVINVGSLNGVNAHMGSADYNVTKEALRALTRTAAREWAPFGITCNVICPAAVSAAVRRVAEAHPAMIERIHGANPMGRLGDPDRDIAGVVAFLASEDARYLTGNTLFIDGGAHINGVAWAPDLDATEPA